MLIIVNIYLYLSSCLIFFCPCIFSIEYCLKKTFEMYMLKPAISGAIYCSCNLLCMYFPLYHCLLIYTCKHTYMYIWLWDTLLWTFVRQLNILHPGDGELNNTPSFAHVHEGAYVLTWICRGVYAYLYHCLFI